MGPPRLEPSWRQYLAKPGITAPRLSWKRPVVRKRPVIAITGTPRNTGRALGTRGLRFTCGAYVKRNGQRSGRPVAGEKTGGLPSPYPKTYLNYTSPLLGVRWCVRLYCPIHPPHPELLRRFYDYSATRKRCV